MDNDHFSGLESSSQRFPKSLRLRTSRQFQRVYEFRCSAADKRLVVYAAPNELGIARLGLAVSRKVGNAVVRNRWKRLIREAFRRNRPRLPVGVDLIVLPKRGASLPTYDALLDSLRCVARIAAKKAFKRASSPPTSPGDAEPKSTSGT